MWALLQFNPILLYSYSIMISNPNANDVHGNKLTIYFSKDDSYTLVLLNIDFGSIVIKREIGPAREARLALEKKEDMKNEKDMILLLKESM